jgi:hypothetical protein
MKKHGFQEERTFSFLPRKIYLDILLSRKNHLTGPISDDYIDDKRARQNSLSKKLKSFTKQVK